MARRLVLLLGSVLLMGAFAPAAALATPPEGYRVITYRHADGSFASADGCVGTEVFFGSGAAVYGARPGPVNKQAGPTDVLVIISDLCAEPVGKGYPVIALWQGQAMIGLESDAQLSRAWVDAAFTVYDDVGVAETAHLSMLWESTGRATRDPVHSHVRFPGEAVVNSHDNNTFVDAVATGTVSVGDWSLNVLTADAHLSSVKAGCQVILHPQVDADFDCV
jgi:hypothetical protein